MRRVLTALVAVMLLTVLTPAAWAGTWLSYDSGVLYGGSPSHFSGVWFALPAGWSQARLLTVRFMWSAYPAGVNIHFTAGDHLTPLVAPQPFTTTSASTWNQLDVSGLNIIAPAEFFILVEDLGTGTAVFDAGPSADRSFYGEELGYLFINFSNNLLIRVEVEQVLFADGFESGDTTAWSGTVPAP